MPQHTPYAQWTVPSTAAVRIPTGVIRIVNGGPVLDTTPGAMPDAFVVVTGGVPTADTSASSGLGLRVAPHRLYAY